MKPQILDALSMCVLNLGVSTVLATFLLVHALYGWPNPFVTVIAPLAIAVFLVLTATWALELTRRARLARAASRTPEVPESVPTLFRRPFRTWSRL